MKIFHHADDGSLVCQIRNRLPTGFFSPISLTAASFRIKCIESAFVPLKLRFCRFILKKDRKSLSMAIGVNDKGLVGGFTIPVVIAVEVFHLHDIRTGLVTPATPGCLSSSAFTASYPFAISRIQKKGHIFIIPQLLRTDIVHLAADHERNRQSVSLKRKIGQPPVFCGKARLARLVFTLLLKAFSGSNDESSNAG